MNFNWIPILSCINIDRIKASLFSPRKIFFFFDYVQNDYDRLLNERLQKLKSLRFLTVV